MPTRVTLKLNQDGHVVYSGDQTLSNNTAVKDGERVALEHMSVFDSQSTYDMGRLAFQSLGRFATYEIAESTT
jgi:hypothetical protein